MLGAREISGPAGSGGEGQGENAHENRLQKFLAKESGQIERRSGEQRGNQGRYCG